MEKLLIIDDNAEIRKQLKWGLGKEYRVLLAGDATEALSIFKAQGPQVVTLDLGLPPNPDGAEEGLRCLREMLTLDPAVKVVVISGNEERANALKAVGLGAYDFYQKPIELGELRIILARAFHLAALEAENRRLQRAMMADTPAFLGIFGHCPEMQTVFNTIRKVATCDVPVLILGESGTGKELVAQAIHSESRRRCGPFIPINCGAIPENLLESELFGHEKGSFTGAQARVQGKFEYADKGTLFLDEIGELPPVLQVKILRFLQDQRIQRVGGREDIDVDARIIAATNIDMEKAIRGGSFREDLYYRIGVITINLPPLRERGEDIVLLGNLFLGRFSEVLKKRVRGFSVAALEALQDYGWPGNVRELENKVKRAVIMAEGALLEPQDLGFATMESSAPAGDDAEMTLRAAKDRVERDLVTAAIAKQNGNILRAAEMLGISRPTIYDLMKKHGLQNTLPTS
ncbi:two-component sigma54-specific transcriptional regulator, Fis family [Desulfuromonas soudanensis]|uniref:Two-component sigma54-specific transcriptional regulator, Fis family n=1 Tax=Desulfuromonas soudanensis TaxID=1603606 RepID=A0A0M4CXB7_9BACT|nr:PEP-CTERM-box response regulator transcription factor [Desulfuromonas soudanensis]ALC16841.1 two-component sigma54-specific transcriptional regulator, Fis family [Desulfuromonas soudanensis]